MGWLGSFGSPNTRVTSGKYSGGFSDADMAGAAQVNQTNAQNQHLINSFKTLDNATRQKLLTSFQKTAPDKYNLLKGHAKDSGNATPNYQDNSLSGKIYRFDQGMNRTNVPVKKAVEGIIGNTVDAFLGSSGQQAGEQVTRLKPTKANPSGKFLNVLPGSHTNDLAEQVAQGAENSGVGKAQEAGIALARKGYDFVKAADLLSKGVRPTEIAHANIGQLNNILDRNITKVPVTRGGVKVPVKAYEQPKLGAGETAPPLGLPEKTSVPYKSNKIPGGGVMVDHTSADARTVANSDAVQEQGARDVMDQLAKDHADMIRQAHKDTGGVAILKDEEGYTTGRRTQNDSFYRGFYKTNGKPPTKEDWLKEAHRQLSKGSSPEAEMYQQAKAYLENPDHTPTEEAVKAGQRIAGDNPNITQGAPKAKTNLNTLMQRLSSSKNENGNRISRLKTLNDIIEHPDASNETKQRAMSLRDVLKKSAEDEQATHQKALDQLAKDHSAKTGQPVESAHQTLASGHGEHADLYKAVKQSQQRAKAIAYDLPTSMTREAPTKEEIVPTVDRSREAENASKRNPVAAVRELFSPETRSQLSRETGVHMRNAMARAANAADVEHLQGKEFQKHFSKLSSADQVKDISDYERTGKSDLAPKGYDKYYKASMEEAHKIATKVLGEDKVGWVENYVRHMFEFGSQKAEQQGLATLRRLAGEKGFTKERTLDMPLDEALAEMRSKGVDVKARITNREELRQYTVANAKRLQAFDDGYRSLQDSGVISNTQHSGYVQLSRELVQKLSPEASTKPQYAAPEVATMLRNMTAKGLSGVRAYDLAKEVSGLATQAELSFSGFHAGMTALTNGVSHLADAFKNISRGDLLSSGKSLAKSIPGVGVTKDFLAGRSLRNGLKAGSAKAIEELNTISKMGGRIALQSHMKSQMTEKMVQAFGRHSLGGVLEGTARLPLAVVQQTARPLMEYAIPRIKDGMLLDRAAAIARQHGGLDSTEARIALAKAQASIDNRMGEIVFDNKFWNKSAKDLAQLAYLSAGYRSGTVAELGGGLVDTGKLAHGELTDRTAFLAALPVYIGTMGAVYQYLHTGKGPQELKDYFYPHNGQTDESGNKVRVQLPSYFKDLRNLVTNPGKEVGSNAPVINMLSELNSNKDYFGNLIRNPSDPASKQAIQVGQYLMSQLSPISVQNSGKTGSGAGPATEGFFGVTKAPAAENQSAVQQRINNLLNTQPGLGGAKTPEQQAQSQLETKVRQEIQKGQNNTPDTAKLKALLGDKKYSTFLSTAGENSTQRAFDLLSTANKMKVIQQSSPKDLSGIKADTFIKDMLTNANSRDSLKQNGYTVQDITAALKKVGVNSPDQARQIIIKDKQTAKTKTRANALQNLLNRRKSYQDMQSIESGL